MGDICSGCRLEVFESRDFKLLESLIFDEDIVKGILSENYSYQENKLDDKDIIYYLFVVDNDPVGFCAFLDISKYNSTKNYLVDIGFIKSVRGKLSYKLADIAKKKFFSEHKPNKLYACIKKNNKKSLFFAMRNGFYLLNKDNENYFLEAVWVI